MPANGIKEEIGSWKNPGTHNDRGIFLVLATSWLEYENSSSYLYFWRNYDTKISSEETNPF